MKAMIMTASICGREKSKADNPYLPVTPDEIITDGIKSFKLGVPQLHIHARDRDGNPTYDPKVFGEILDAFRKACPNVILQISTGGTYHKPEELFIPLLKLKPDIASLALQEKKEENVSLIKHFYEHSVSPIVECFSIEKVKETVRLFEEGHFKAPLSIEFLLEDKNKGRHFSALAEDILEFYRICSAHDDIIWSVCRGANHELAVQALVSALGGHLRTGLEDVAKHNDGSYIKASTEVIGPAMEIAAKMGRAIADIPTARKILGV